MTEVPAHIYMLCDSRHKPYTGVVLHTRFEHLEADVRPFAYGFEVHAAIDERLGEVASAGAEGVCANGYWSGRLIGFEEFNRLTGRIQLP